MIKSTRTNHKKTVLFTLAMIAFIAGVMIWSGCNQGGTDEFKDKIGKKTQKTRKKSKPYGRDNKKDKSLSTTPQAPEGGWIKRVYFTPHYDENGNFLKVNVETTLPQTENQRFSYLYWKNFDKWTEKDSDDDKVAYSSLKTGDFIYVEATLYQDDQFLEKKRSEGLMVKNTDPIIQKVNLPEINGPGSYQIPVNAKDAEGDQLTFSLEADPESSKSLFGGLSINSNTGTITCKLGEESPPKILKFVVIANDGRGGIAKKMVTINFQINNGQRDNTTRITP